MKAKQQSNKIDIRKLFQKASNPSGFKGIKEYIVPTSYFDSKKIMLQREILKANQKAIYRKFVPSPLKKPCFMDEAVKPYTLLPSPDRYDTSKNIARNFKSMANLLKPSQDICRNTFFDQIEKDGKKIKRPSVGSYNLLTQTDFKKQKSLITSVVSQKFRKYDVIDNVQCLSSEVPGPGSHNPHKTIEKLKINRMTPRLSRQRSQDLNAKQKNRLKARGSPSPLAYSPVKEDTFAKTAYNKQHKVKLNSSFKEIIIDKRKGLRSKIKSPSPLQYSLINQWAANFKPLQKNYGKIDIFGKISKSRSISNSSIYH